MKRLILLLYLACCLTGISAQVKVIKNEQHHYPKTIPAGNYSGIAWMGGDRYAVVSDKSDTDGFFVFEIKTDSVSGEILSARNLGFHSSGKPARDDEGITWCPQTATLWISGERDNRIFEYDSTGKRTGRELTLPDRYRHLPANLGLEALTFNPSTQTFWTCNEADSVWVQSFGLDLKPAYGFDYQLDAPEGDASKAWQYAHGIGTLCALDDGSLLVLEREFYVPRTKIGAWVDCKLYRVNPHRSSISSQASTHNAQSSILNSQPSKMLLTSWRTSLTLFSRSLANYEGMCLGPTLKDGSRVLLLVADSQNQFGGVLKDWITSIKICQQ